MQLLKPATMPMLRATTEAAVVDVCHRAVVVRELDMDPRRVVADAISEVSGIG
jgi:hypothetical protein